MTEENPTNTLGIISFVLAMIGIFFGWVPFIGWLIVLAALILGIIGLTKPRKGFAIAGVIISGVSIIFWLFIIAIFSLFAYSGI